MEQKNIIMDESAVGRALTRITYEILEHNRGAQELCLVGILSRGAVIAGRIAERIRALEGTQVDCGVLDITAYRDDVPAPEGLPDRTQIPFSTRDRHVVLCDDVLYTGRTARAAMDAVIRHGRPRSVQLAVLVDRGHREVPIRPDYVGKNLPTSRSETVRVSVREIDGEDKVSICLPEPSGGEE
ncbi:MAG: bifunctional pyr operon transcriptional regulator/uracil phosphoribosyltransferase PyrR [Oscillospiraceae bacterium]|nr:bifunctional pyr operon transcriptional regulator/uracil phosphoribosyltransferase PyrR [Oscillospiraceae bacterium]